MIAKLFNFISSIFGGINKSVNFVTPDFLQLFIVGGIMYFLYTLTWMISVKKKDVSLVNFLWGFSFCIQALIYYYKSLDYTLFHIFTLDRFSWEKLTFTFFMIAHGIRLSAYLMVREIGHDGEDKRWANLRERFGGKFWWVSFFYVFMPALFVNLTMGSVIYAFENSSKANINHFQYFIGILTMIFGGMFGGLADLQQYLFQNDKKNSGKILNTGLWALCRHPNYFGEVLFWIGAYIVNYSAGILWTIICPLVFTLMIVYVTGIPVQEKLLREEYGSKYEEYIKTVPSFIPLPFLGGNILKAKETEGKEMSDTPKNDEKAKSHIKEKVINSTNADKRE